MAGSQDAAFVRSGVSALPGRGVVHLGVVLREVALDSIDVVLGQVDATARPLHHVAGCHNRARDGVQLAVDDVGDEQLVRREVVLVVLVVPDMRVAILLVRPVLGARPLADTGLCSGTIPLTVAVGHRQVLECGNTHTETVPDLPGRNQDSWFTSWTSASR